MAVTKRNTKKETPEKKEEATKPEEVKPKEVKPTPKKEVSKENDYDNNVVRVINRIRFILISITTFCVVVGAFVATLKKNNPELYSKRIEIFFPNAQQKNVPVAQPVETQPVEAEPKHHKINLDDYDDVINLEEKAYIKEMMKQEEIKEKLKDKPELLKVKDYYDEPIGQMVRRLSLEKQIVLFINSNDERCKVTRLAISQTKVPFGIIEVDGEPRGYEMREALFRMTAQRTFPFIFVNGKFFGNSFALQRAMQDHSFYELVDSEKNKANWLAEKEEYAQKIEKRRKQKEERERKKLEQIKKKIEEKTKGSA